MSSAPFVSNGEWEEKFEGHHATLEEAVAHCRLLLADHPRAMFTIVGEGHVVQVRATDKVRAR